MKHGDCYRYATERVFDEGGWLVFGYYPDDFGQHEHAWHEKYGLVRDYQHHGRRLPGHRAILGPAMREGILRDEYPGVEVRRYRPREAARAFLRFGYFGPWGLEVPGDSSSSSSSS